MSKLRVAFYRAEYGELDDKYIDRFSGNKGYSHCELVLDAKTMIGSHYLRGGVNIFHYNDIYASKYWDIVEINIDNKYAVEYAKETVGVGYDTIGVICEFHGLGYCKNLDKVWCSEHTAKCMNRTFDQRGFAISKIRNTRIMPNELFTYMMKDLGGKIVRSTASSSNIYYKPEVDRFGRIE